MNIGFENGNITTTEKTMEMYNLKWNEHKSFKGVFLKHLVTGQNTKGALSCHLVKVNPHCCLDTHTHEGILEIHEVIYGTGFLILDKESVEYSVGSLAVIPADTNHKVTSGKDGLYILAKFSPALL